MNKFMSRKFIVTCIQGLALFFIPIIYQKIGISETVLLTVLGATSALTASYLGVNVMQKKGAPNEPAE